MHLCISKADSQNTRMERRRALQEPRGVSSTDRCPSPTAARSRLTPSSGWCGIQAVPPAAPLALPALPKNTQLSHKGLWLWVCVTQHTSVRPPEKITARARGVSGVIRECRNAAAFIRQASKEKVFHLSLENVRTGRSSTQCHPV